MKPPLELFSLERKGCPVAGWPFRFEGSFPVLGEDRGRRRRPGLAIERWEFSEFVLGTRKGLPSYHPLSGVRDP
jgi:hypothetical protein